MNAVAEISTALIEPSFADMIERIEADEALPKDRKVHWRCSIGIIAKGLGKDITAIPARWMAIKLAVGELHHERMGITAKTLASHRANLKAALRRPHASIPLPSSRSRGVRSGSRSLAGCATPTSSAVRRLHQRKPEST